MTFGTLTQTQFWTSKVVAGFHPKKKIREFVKHCDWVSPKKNLFVKHCGWVCGFNYENVIENWKHLKCVFSFYNSSLKHQRIEWWKQWSKTHSNKCSSMGPTRFGWWKQKIEWYHSKLIPSKQALSMRLQSIIQSLRFWLGPIALFTTQPKMQKHAYPYIFVSHSTIHIFKNYFVTMFSVISF